MLINFVLATLPGGKHETFRFRATSLFEIEQNLYSCFRMYHGNDLHKDPTIKAKFEGAREGIEQVWKMNQYKTEEQVQQENWYRIVGPVRN